MHVTAYTTYGGLVGECVNGWVGGGVRGRGVCIVIKYIVPINVNPCDVSELKTILLR